MISSLNRGGKSKDKEILERWLPGRKRSKGDGFILSVGLIRENTLLAMPDPVSESTPE